MEHRTELIEEPKIPADMVELFSKVIALCKEYGCTGADLKISPSWEGAYWGQLQCQWHCGRHGDAAKTVVMCELRSHIQV